jgi:hypothetical protein
LSELNLPVEYTKTAKGDNFLLHDSGPGQTRFLVFSTGRNMELLAQSSNWYADGTFKTAPPLFQQIYTIHVLANKVVIPLVYILMNDRSTSTYVKVLTAIKDSHPGLNPATVMTDFEQAAILAFKTVFPNVVQQGCLFHLSQCIWRRMQQISGLQQRYSADAEFALGVRHLAALAFVPTADVTAVFDELMESPFFTEHCTEVRELTNYFEDTWIGRPGRRGGRDAPMFAIRLWNVHAQVTEDIPKTNNSVEGMSHYLFLL